MALEPLVEKDLLVILLSRKDSHTRREPKINSFEGPSFTILFIRSRSMWPNHKFHNYVLLIESVFCCLIDLGLAILNNLELFTDLSITWSL